MEKLLNILLSSMIIFNLIICHNPVYALDIGTYDYKDISLTTTASFMLISQLMCVIIQQQENTHS